MPRIAVCCAILGDTPEAQQAYATLMKDNINSHVEYCNQHKYDYICATSLEQISPRALEEPRRKFSWYKILLLQRLTEDYDYVLWVDADTRIQNFGVALETLVEKFMGAQHIALAGLSNLEVYHIQFGSVLIKKSGDTRRWLETIWRQTQFLEHFWWEQAAVIHLFHTQFEFASRLSLLPASWPMLQCFPTHNENPNSLVIHYAGKLRNHMPRAEPMEE